MRALSTELSGRADVSRDPQRVQRKRPLSAGTMVSGANGSIEASKFAERPHLWQFAWSGSPRSIR